jgi:hypothetical protein
MKGTTCKKCNRFVWTDDVGEDGLCCFCKPEEKPKRKKEKKTHFFGSSVPSLAVEEEG